MNFPLRLCAWLFAGAGLLSAQTPTTKGQPTPLQLGTWNLEFLGAPGNLRNDVPPRTDADLAAIGAKVRSLGVAVLAVQEVCGEAPLQKVAAGAGPRWTWVLGTSGSWNDGKTAQSIGFLYDQSRVELLYAEELSTFPRELEGVPIFHRVPVTACFRDRATGFDFRMVTVHLKAGKRPVDEQKRRLEATTLHEWLAQLEASPDEDEDIVLLGDFNSTYGSEPERVLEQNQTVAYLRPKAPTPTIMHFDEPIDQIGVAPGFGELQPDSFVVHNQLDGLDKTAWRKIYSDHFPVTVTVLADGDQDPQAKFSHGQPTQRLPAQGLPAQASGARPGSTPTTTAPHWPPPVGSLVTITLSDHQVVRGKLLCDIPGGAVGWIVLDPGANGAVRAVPLGQVLVVDLQ